MTGYRYDLVGLRAVAVLLVVLGHAFAIPGGGFVGIDVFFVVSGFLITRRLVREQEQDGAVSVGGLFAGRARRVLPATAVTVVATIVATYAMLGFLAGNAAATTGKWTAIFAVNIRFALAGTDYPGFGLPPSPLQQMWPLAVAAQFHAVWLAVFLIAAPATRRLRVTLTAALAAIAVTSLAWAVVQTGSDAVWAYFSPFTRAFELAFGAMVAVWAPVAATALRGWQAHTLAAVGILVILASAALFSPDAPYPGTWAVIPVLGSAGIIAAGCRPTGTAANRLLAVRPLRWIGARSHSIYLWHWPFLVIPAEYGATGLPTWQRAALLLAAIATAALTYRLVERPVQNSRFLASRPRLVLALGAAVVLLVIGFAQYQIATHYGTWNPLETAG